MRSRKMSTKAFINAMKKGIGIQGPGAKSNQEDFDIINQNMRKSISKKKRNKILEKFNISC